MSFVGGPGIFRAMKDENMIVGIDGDAGNLAEDHAVRKNGPAVHHRVGISGILLGRRRASEKCGQEKRKHEVSTKNQHGPPLRLQTSRVLRVQFAMAEIIGAKRRQKTSEGAVHVPKAVKRSDESTQQKKTSSHAETREDVRERFAGRV